MRNVILLSIDGLRKDVFGCYGSKEPRTPFLDSIQAKCIQYGNAQAAGPYTQASFPAILTSSYYLEYGKHKNLPSEKTMISEVLRNRGITTAAFHSNTYLSYYFGYNRGWITFHDSMQEEVSDRYPYIRGEALNDKVYRWLSEHTKRKGNEPFFLWIHYMDVHEPYIAEDKYLKIVDPAIDLTEDKMLGLFKDSLLPRDVSNPKSVGLLRLVYEAQVLEVDQYVKDFFEILDSLSLLQNTTIIITSDHGEEFGEHGGLSHDGKMYSELIDIPLFIFESERNSKQVFANPVSNVDISPTIASLYDIEPPKNFFGTPLLPTDGYSNRGCYGEAIEKIGNKEKDTDQPIYYFRRNNIKIIYKRNGDVWEMYNLDKDPQETKNIIDTSAEAELFKELLIEEKKSKCHGRKD